MTTWNSVSQDGTDWQPVTTEGVGGAFADLAFGYGIFGGSAASSWSTVSKASSSWSAVSQQTSSWAQVAQSGKVEAMFEYNEPLGGPVWTAVTKDS